jgi:signal transduction histidine kinase
MLAAMRSPSRETPTLGSRVARWLRLSALESEEERRVAGFVGMLAAFGGAASLLAAGVNVVRSVQRLETSAVLAAYAAVSGLAIWLLWRRRVEAAGRLMFLATATLTTLLVLTGAERGFRDMGMMVYPVVVIFASLFLSRRDFAIGLGIVLATLGLVLVAELSGRLNAWPSPRDVLVDFGHAALVVLLAGFTARLVTDSLTESTRRLRDNERALAAANASLLERARERDRLIRELEARNAELESFAYTVTHDLKSPLITIGGFLPHIESHAERGDREALRGDLDRVRRSQARLLRLLDELFELSRAGKASGPPELVALADAAREARDLVGGRLSAKGMSATIAADLPQVRGDRLRLVQLFQNLLDNAAKFGRPAAQPRVEIGLRPDGAEPVVFVRDNGIGIAPAHHERVFGLFQRLDPDQEGTGVGLVLVKRIVEAHGGRIWIESEGIGRGSTFCFTLPGLPAGDEASREGSGA